MHKGDLAFLSYFGTQCHKGEERITDTKTNNNNTQGCNETDFNGIQPGDLALILNGGPCEIYAKALWAQQKVIIFSYVSLLSIVQAVAVPSLPYRIYNFAEKPFYNSDTPRGTIGATRILRHVIRSLKLELITTFHITECRRCVGL